MQARIIDFLFLSFFVFLILGYMYAKCYGNFYQAKDTMAEIPGKNSFQACDACFDCSAKCTHQIDISRRIKELKAIWC